MLFTHLQVDGRYPYDTVVIPLTVEALKLLLCTLLLAHAFLTSRGKDKDFQPRVTLDWRSFLKFSVPGLCYMVSNNCTFVIIGELGATSFQVLANLKILVTALLMRVLLSRRISWLRWKALVLLVLGAMVTQLGGEQGALRGSFLGYVAVALSSLMSGLAGVYSEKLLKGDASGPARNDSIYWQNIQLYIFGIIFGMLALHSKRMAAAADAGAGDQAVLEPGGVFDGFNMMAYLCVLSIALSGMLVSAVLKYIDNIAKCFVAAVSLVVVAAFGTLSGKEEPSINILIGIVLVALALEQYNLPQTIE